MVIDYSKWDNLSVYSSSDGGASSGDEEDDGAASCASQLPQALWELIFARLPIIASEGALHCDSLIRRLR